MARLPSTISLMRRGGTPIAFASAVCDSAIGFRKSSIRISPGWGFFNSMIVDDLDFVRIVLAPDEANPPLLIDADRILTFPVSFESFQPIGWRHTQVFEPLRVVEKTQLSKRRVLNVRRQLATAMAGPNDRRLVAAKADDHRPI